MSQRTMQRGTINRYCMPIENVAKLAKLRGLVELVVCGGFAAWGKCAVVSDFESCFLLDLFNSPTFGKHLIRHRSIITLIALG
jgi:hypothetical protein